VPNCDGGHYFLTALAPIDMARAPRTFGAKDLVARTVRDVLATLPTALQSQAAEALGINSPFARCTRTHFARFVVIDDVVYNGRDPMDAIETAVRRVSPTTPQSQDRLSRPYLLFVADFDAKSGDVSELRTYLKGLWGKVGPELGSIFGFCSEFPANPDADTFASYIERCQIETTMPFNDYWTVSPPLKSWTGLLIATLLGLVAIDVAAGWSLSRLGGWRPWPWAILAVAAGFLVSLLLLYKIVMIVGARPSPAAPGSDLPSILKALYLQQHFARLVPNVQGASDTELWDAFGAFVAAHKPLGATPTQPPGVIHS